MLHLAGGGGGAGGVAGGEVELAQGVEQRHAGRGRAPALDTRLNQNSILFV